MKALIVFSISLFLHSFAFGSSEAVATYKDPYFLMITSETFGEIEEDQVHPFEVQHKITLSKLGLQFRRNRNKIYEPLNYSFNKYIDSTATTINLDIDVLGLYKIYFKF